MGEKFTFSVFPSSWALFQCAANTNQLWVVLAFQNNSVRMYYSIKNKPLQHFLDSISDQKEYYITFSLDYFLMNSEHLIRSTIPISKNICYFIIKFNLLTQMTQEKYLIHQNNSKPCAFPITFKMAYSFHHVWLVKDFLIYDL